MNDDQFTSAIGKAALLEAKAAVAFAGARELSDLVKGYRQPLQHLRAQLAELKDHPGHRGDQAFRDYLAKKTERTERDIAEAKAALDAIESALVAAQEDAQHVSRHRDATAKLIARTRRERDALNPMPTEPATRQHHSKPYGGAHA